MLRLLDKSRRAADARRSSASPTRCASSSRRSSQADRARCSSPARRAPASRRRSTACSTRSTVPEINIITVEDPVEYRLAGVNQVQMNPKARPHVRDGPAHDPALRPRRDHGRRDPRRRDGEDLDRVRADGPLRPLDAAHERRAERADAPQRDGRRAVPHRLRRHRRARAAPRPASSARTAARRTRRRPRSSPRRASRPSRSRPPTGRRSTARRAARAAATPATRAGSACSSSW